jgi:hypothetical protein
MLRNQRRLSRNLTLHYGGVLYVLEDTPEADAARGTRVDVYETEDGATSIRAGRPCLTTSARSLALGASTPAYSAEVTRWVTTPS